MKLAAALFALFFWCFVMAPALAQGTPQLRDMVASAARQHGVPVNVALAVIAHESGFHPRIRGRAGEYGLGQVLCGAARAFGFRGNCSQLLDPATNLEYSMKILAVAIQRGGATCAGVSMYNFGVYGRPRCTAYGRAVMARAARERSF